MAGVRLFLVLLLAVVAAVPTIATDYNVGDDKEWELNVNYTTWVSGKTFKVGDNLVFKYAKNHDVKEVNQAAYNSCSSTNAISTHTDGNTTIPLNTTTSRYFICGIGDHCSQGMKLTVSVSPAASSPPPSTTPSPPSSSPPPTTPVSGGPSSETPPTSTSPPPPPSPSAAMTTSSYYNMNTLLFSAIPLCVALLG